jgi:hypothetical protein
MESALAAKNLALAKSTPVLFGVASQRLKSNEGVPNGTPKTQGLSHLSLHVAFSLNCSG